MAVDIVCGKRKAYKIKGLPEVLRRVADQVEKKGNPHPPVYNVEDLERTIQLLEKECGIIIENAYIKNNLKK